MDRTFLILATQKRLFSLVQTNGCWEYSSQSEGKPSAKNFKEDLSQNSQFRKALNIILTIFLGGRFTQDFEEHISLYNISSDPVTASERAQKNSLHLRVR